MPLEKNRKKILVICPHPVGYVPGQRLKYEQYFQSWQANGYDVEVAPFMSEAMQKIVYKKGYLVQKIAGTVGGYLRRIKLLFKIKQYDIVYLFLWATPFGPPLMERIICKLSRKLVYDIDDLVFLKNINHENKFLALLKGKNKPIYMMKHAHHVITCTPYLDAVAQKYNRNTTDISSTINTAIYLPVNTYTNNHQLVIGWSGSHSTSQYLYLLKDVLLELKKVVPFKMLVMGDASFNIPGLDIEAVSWSEEREIATLQKMDIGVYPLPLNEQWVLGKSGLKALQYMALGIPTVATDVGCNNRVIENDVSGFLVLNEHEWLGRLLMLCQNAQLRKSIGQQAIIRVEEHFSVKNTLPVYLDILNKVVAL
jgi:L-malate glycosyltransferase